MKSEFKKDYSEFFRDIEVNRLSDIEVNRLSDINRKRDIEVNRLESDVEVNRTRASHTCLLCLSFIKLIYIID